MIDFVGVLLHRNSEVSRSQTHPPTTSAAHGRG
jgi:hypothetical protein